MNQTLMPGGHLFEAPLDVLQSVVPVLVWELDAQGNVHKASHSHATILGTDARALVGPASHLVHPRDHQALAGALADALAGQPIDVELRLRHADGSYRSALFGFHPVAAPESPVVAVGRLLTVNETDVFRTLTDIAPGTAYLRRTDPGSPAPHFGAGIQKLTGYHRAWFEGGKLSLEDLIVDADRPAVEASIAQALDEGRAFQLRYRLQTRKGEIRHVEDSGRGVWNAHGELIYLAGSLSDIGAIVALEQEKERLERRLQNLEESGPSSSERDTAHALNNLLFTLIGNIELARENLPEGDPSRTLLTEALTAAVGAGRLVAHRDETQSESDLEPSSSANGEPSSLRLSKKRLLLVEDEAAVRSLVSKALRRAGYAVTVAENGRVGLALLQQSTFDLVLLDMKMPEVSGEEFLRGATEVGSLVPVLAVSGHESGNGPASGYGGAYDFLPKPYRPKVLLGRIETLLRRAECLVD